MKIRPFGVEEWMNTYENDAVANIAETCVDSLTVEALLDLSGRKEPLLEQIRSLRLSYGDIPGSDRLRDLVAGLYARQSRDNVLIMNGGAAANFLSLYTLVEAGDEVVSVWPTYQQLTSIPESFGATVKLLPLEPEGAFLPDVERLKALVSEKTRLICINNPNNPTGALMEGPLLEAVVDVARSVGAWIHCDEVYRGLVHEPGLDIPSVADLYEKGISTGSLSKTYSLAGLRLGWIVGPADFIARCFSRRDYTTISCGRIDDLLGSVALEAREALLERNLSIVRRSAAVLREWVDGEARLDWVPPKAGTTAFIRYDYDLPSETFCRRLFEGDGTFIVPGSAFDRDRWFRIGYAFDPVMLRQGLDRISAFLRRLEASGL
ncbi:aminotransferase [Aminithiophilus ramosus]|uniref:Aminotransferase n=2 Tax=Synergistales TaxID=649776 RepID=A0A9Q7EX69_9BACT|nr:aminotransferase [Aminithiophilus ramosus]QTX32215.1 aminotransferase [Aminithiophilus ramosus]QVL36083.1 aminotransferase [Synergistota bacterium]